MGLQSSRVLRETGLGPMQSFLLYPFPGQSPTVLSPGPHQGATAEQNHEDDEGLKPIVLHNEEAGFPQDPPGLAQPLLNVDLAARESLDTTWHQRERQVRLWDVPRPDVPSPPSPRPQPGAAPPHSQESSG